MWEDKTSNLDSLLQQFVERKIHLRAYELYEERGRSEGRALDDWLVAEAEVLATSILSPLFRRPVPQEPRKRKPSSPRRGQRRPSQESPHTPNGS